MQKKVIVASFDNVLLNQGPLHTYAALRAYKKVIDEGLVHDHTSFRYKGFLKEDISPADVISSSPISNGFFFIAFNKLRHLAQNEEDYLKILMLIEKNKELAVKLRQAENAHIYKMFEQSILDMPIELGKQSIGRIAPDKQSKAQFGIVFKDSIRRLSKSDWVAMMRMYGSDEPMVLQLRRLLAHFPIYFATTYDTGVAEQVLEGLLNIGYLKNEDFRYRDTNWAKNASIHDWGCGAGKNYLITGRNVLTLPANGSGLPGILGIISSTEGARKQDVWFVTAKFKHAVAKAVFEAGFLRRSPLGEGAPRVNMFVIAAQHPFAGQYEKEMAAGVLILEHDKFAEKLIRLASLYK